MSETNNNAAQATDTELREVPSDISEYRKFVEEKGHEHNAQILGREAAVAAARAAGIVPESANGNEAEVKKRANSSKRKIRKLYQEIGARDAEIEALRKAAATHATNGAAKPAGESVSAATPAPAAGPATKQDAPPRPKEEDYKTYSEFVEALTDWKTDRKLEASEAKRAEERARTQNESESKKVLDAHNARVDEAKTRYADWNDAFKGLDDNSFSDPMVVYIFESDRGPDVTYYLATHRDELDRIRKLSPIKQAAALGRIEDGLQESGEGDKGEGEGDEGGAKPAKKHAEDDEPDEEDEKPQPKRKSGASKAPPPVKPLGGKGGSDDAMPDPKDFRAYEAWSRRQAAKGVKR